MSTFTSEGIIGSNAANQPLGMQHGWGLNEQGPRAAALRADIARAIVESGGAISRRDLVRRFSDRASKSPLYRIIDAEVRRSGVKLAPTKWPTTRLPTSAKTDRAEVAAVMPRLAEVEREVAAIEALSRPERKR